MGRTTLVLVLRRRGGDAHRSVAAVNTLHLGKGTLLVGLVGEADEAVATGKSGNGVGHDLCGLARRETLLEDADQNVLVDLGTKVANEDGEFWTTVIPKKQELSVFLLHSKGYD